MTAYIFRSELDSLKERNQELQWILSNFTNEALSGNIKEDVVERLLATLVDKIGGLPINFGGLEKKQSGPSKEYEVKRRGIYKGVQELWYFVNQELEKLKKKGPELISTDLSNLIQEVISSGKEHEAYAIFSLLFMQLRQLYLCIVPTKIRVILNDVQDLSSMEGHDSWRAAEARSLSDLVQRRFHYLQNPADCSKARKLICNLNKVIVLVK